MLIERLPEPLTRPLEEFLQKNETVAALRALFRDIRYHPPEPDTSIAWESGEAEEAPETSAAKP